MGRRTLYVAPELLPALFRGDFAFLMEPGPDAIPADAVVERAELDVHGSIVLVLGSDSFGPDAPGAPAELRPQFATLRGERAALQTFARRVLLAAFEGLDVDGGTIQQWALEAGLLRETEVSEACGPVCGCAEAGGFPTRCLRFTGAVGARMVDVPAR